MLNLAIGVINWHLLILWDTLQNLWKNINTIVYYKSVKCTVSAGGMLLAKRAVLNYH
jgi:hypothetical protein